MFNTKLTPREKISKAKSHLFRRKPFFAYVVDRLVIVKENAIPTMGVDNKGRLLYNEKFVADLPQKELIGVVMHEGLHAALQHVWRIKGRNRMLWNIAADIAVNRIVLANGEALPSSGIIPNGNSITIGGIQIDELEKKSVEDIYNLLKKAANQQQSSSGQGEGQGEGDDDQEGNGSDLSKLEPKNHDKWGDGEGKNDPKSEDEMEAMKKKWEKILTSASVYSKMQGQSPLGCDRDIEELHASKINWKAILRRTVASFIPSDFSWRRPSKKFIWNDVYLPSTDGGSAKVLVAIDTSGSVSPKEMTDYVSEMLGMARSFSQVDFRVLCHDTDVYDLGLIRNGNRQKLMQLKPKGGGGTDHCKLMKYIEEKGYYRKDSKLLITFTDGYSSFPETKPPYRVLIVLAGSHAPKEQMPSWADVIEMV
jgi:predicted metal-dependent peptidase